ncbi:hypothetical protein KJ781_03695 [Patescibacteria group bacterium]|nr:hypothetical protein [Patescibacteria group bacterium]MBU1448484.1 hypothetical protein [Patescibacteria group bacterium]MBU2613365.1 hypothetical protein [Patescibacteria group bacterium]
MHSRTGAVAKLLIVDLFGSVAWFPVWWYTKGLERVFVWVRRSLQYRAASYAFRIWIKNMLVPMYGQYDWTGRLVSVFMRIIVLIGRSVAFVAEALVYGIGIIAWIAAPIIFALLAAWNITSGAFLRNV